MSYPFKRVIEALAVTFIIVSLTFFLLRLLPGSPFDEEVALSSEMQMQLEEHYGLHKPLLQQYMIYIENIFSGHWGESYKYAGKDVFDLIMDSLPATLLLGQLSLLFSYLLGIPLGLITAYRYGQKIDRIFMLLIMSAVSLPAFVLAPILVLIFSFWLDILPPALWLGPKYVVLPLLALSARPLALIVRLIRVTAYEALHAEYVQAARAKGLSETKILFKHVLKNSLVPLLSISGSLFSSILAGSFIIETIFAVPGISHHFIEGVLNRDYPLILSMTCFYSFLLIFANMFFDIIIKSIDPRIKFT